jgi:L-ascorbate metabolism protein UlaG (beta-lactamase superfamily)
MKACLALSLVLGMSFAVSSDNVRICHTANAGFFASDGKQSVLIDTVIQQGLKGYDQPSERLIADIEKGNTPFDKPSVVLVTHYHADHFDPASTLRHLRANPRATYIMPPQAFTAVEQLGLSEQEANRISTPLPPMDGDAVSSQFGNITVETYRISHGPNRPIENLGYRFSFKDGPTFFHPGDMVTDSAQLSSVGIENLPVDYLLLPFWAGGDAETKMMVDASWDAKHIVPMHFQSEAQPWMASRGGPEGVRKAALENWDNSIRLIGEMRCEETK